MFDINKNGIKNNNLFSYRNEPCDANICGRKSENKI